MKRRVLWIGSILIIASLLGAGGILWHPRPTQAKGENDFYRDLEIFTDALSIVKSDYVEEKPSKEMIYGALRGMLSALDPHSQFMDPDTYNEVKIETEGAFGGLGIEITIQEGLLTIVSPIDDTPAYRAGLMAKDHIVKIDGELTRDITLLQAVKKMRGKPGTSVQLTVLREGEDKLLDFTVTRDIIRIKSIKEAKMIEEGIGYIRLSEFQENTPKDFEQALGDLEKKQLKGLILDVRNNPGGLLNTAVEVSEAFVPKGEMVVYTKGRIKDQDLEFRSRAKHPHSGYPLVVLVNGGSASGSEILAGAVQDHKLGILLGTKTFGKGSVQTVIPLRDGSALRLTTSKYFTPSGRVIHEKGIIPDLVVPLEEKKEGEKEDREKKKTDVFEKLEKEEEAPKKLDQAKEEATKKEESKKEKSKEEEKKEVLDNQLQRAVDLIKGINLYQSKKEG